MTSVMERLIGITEEMSIGIDSNSLKYSGLKKQLKMIENHLGQSSGHNLHQLESSLDALTGGGGKS